MSKGYQIETRGTIEVIVMRVLFAAIVIWSMPTAEQMSELTAQSRPVGLAKHFDLTFLANPDLLQIRFPGAIGHIMRMGHVVSENSLFSANFTNTSHDVPSLRRLKGATFH